MSEAEPAPDVSDRPYLFPVPGSVLRRGLNLQAQLGERFREDDVVADVMLDLDAVASPSNKARDKYGTGLPHSYSYYAKRWGWSKTEVSRALKGDDRRGEGPWARERAADWRSFFARDRERLGTPGNDLGTKRPPAAPERPDPGTVGNDLGTVGNGIGQTSDSQTGEGAGARARAREVMLALGFDAPALVAEAQDSAAGAATALTGRDLVSAALCLQLTGRIPDEAQAVFASLDGPASAALLVAVLRTGEKPRTGPRTNYLRKLAASLRSHDTETRYAAAHPDAPADEGGSGGPLGTAGRQAGGQGGSRSGGGSGRALAVRGAAGPAPGPRLSAAERRGQFGPSRAAELVAAARALGPGGPGHGGDGDAR